MLSLPIIIFFLETIQPVTRPINRQAQLYLISRSLQVQSPTCSHPPLDYKLPVQYYQEHGSSFAHWNPHQKKQKNMEIVIKTNQDLYASQTAIQQDRNLSEKTVSTTGLFRFADSLDILLMAVGSISSAAMGAAIPIFAYLTGNMIDSFSTSNDIYQQAKKNLLYYIYLGLGALIVGTAMFSCWMIAGERQAARCRRFYFESLLRQQMAWFDLQLQAAISTTFQLDSMSFQMAVGEKISTLIMVFGMLAAGLGISFYLGWILTLIILGYLPIIIISWTINIAIKSETAQQEDQIYRESDAKLQQSLGAITLVKQMNAEQFQVNIQTKILTKIKQKYVSTIKKYVCASSIALLTLYLGFALAFWYGSQCVFNTQKCPQRLSSRAYTAGSVVKIFYSLFLPALSLNQLAPSLQKIAEGKAAATRIFAIIDRIPKIKSKEGAHRPEEFKGVFQFKDVIFAYPKDKSTKIINRLNLKIDCMHSGIIGKSGSGKSTIFQLMMRFYDPDEGAIFLDGIDLRDLDLGWLRSQIGYVTQQPVLFAFSIKENLLLGKRDASDQDLQNALRKAQALEFVNDFQQRLGTYVGSGGSQLSGGQKQRIAIARALVKQPKLLLLDEATSALDNRNEASILMTLSKFYNQFRTISITHRKRVLKNCDKIFEFQNGRIKTTTYNKERKRQEYVNPIIQESINISMTCTHLSTENRAISESAAPITITSTVQSFGPQKFSGKLTKTNRQVVESRDKEPLSDSSLSRIIPYALENKGQLLLGIILPIVDGLMFPAVGLMFSRIVASELQYSLDPEYHRNQVHIYIYVVVGISVVGSCTNSFSLLVYSLLGESAVKKIRLEAVVKVLKMPVGWFQREQNNTEKVTSTVTRSCKVIYNFVKLFTPHLIFVIVNILSSMIAALAFEWRTGLTSFALIPLIILSQAIQLGFIQGFAESKSKVYGQSSQKVNQSVMNIRTIFSLNSETAVTDNYNREVEQIFQILSKKCMLSGFMYGLSYFLQFISFALMFFLAAVYVTRYQIAVENSLAAIFLVVFAGISAGNNSNFMPDISEAKTAANKLFGIIDEQDEHQLRASLGSKSLTTPIKGNIQFKNVTFRYDNRDSLALDNFSMHIRSGQSVAIVGPSGCGKSTLFALLLGFYTPSSGTILLQGIDIQDFDLHHLRASFGVVSQEPILFNESAAWNIRYNLADTSEEKIIQAAREVNLACQPEIVQQQMKQIFPDCDNSQAAVKGLIILEKNVGPKGSHVSGGQKQRIAIARTILRRPTVLLLDEATSALDRNNELKVQGSLQGMMKGMTTIGITHRLETLDEADLIIVLCKGKVEECGSYHDLMDRRKVFYQLATGMIQIAN